MIALHLIEGVGVGGGGPHVPCQIQEKAITHVSFAISPVGFKKCLRCMSDLVVPTDYNYSYPFQCL